MNKWHSAGAPFLSINGSKVEGWMSYRSANSIWNEMRGMEDGDRYSDIDKAYLLQRSKEHEGAAILARNPKANIPDRG